MKLNPFITENRKSKIISVVEKRQPSVHVVFENIHDPHNVSAILRTCDAVGVPKVSLLYNIESFPKIGKKSSASAFKWIEREKYKSVEECYSSLKENGFKIYASAISERSKDLYDFDFTGKVALVFGNEHRGISPETEKLADELFYIPMHGMVQSLNVSVAAAVTLYEVLRQRKLEGLYDSTQLNEEEYNMLLNKYSKRK